MSDSLSMQRQILDLSARLERLEKPDVPRHVGARVYRTTDQTLTTGVAAAIAFTIERYDTDALHDNSTNNTRLTVPITGKYLVVGHARFATNGTGVRELRIIRNGTTASPIAYTNMNPPSASTANLMIATIWNMAAADYVELYAFQNSGGDLAVAAVGDFSPEFMIAYLGV